MTMTDDRTNNNNDRVTENDLKALHIQHAANRKSDIPLGQPAKVSIYSDF
jgi:hypothetical protein